MASSGSSGGGGGQSRTIYSQKQLSPHRMMHFGKRPLFGAPPSLLVANEALASVPLVDPPMVYQMGQGQLLQQQQQDEATLRAPLAYRNAVLKQALEEAYLASAAGE